MRTAICHDKLTCKGGAERVVLELAKELEADVFTLQFNEKASFSGFGELNVTEIGKLHFPDREFLYPWIKPFIHSYGMFEFSHLDLRGYDLVISDKMLSLFAKGKKRLHYCHTPPRMLYDLRDYLLGYLRETYGLHAKLGAQLWWKLWEKFDKKAIEQVDKLITNSKETKRRIKKYYSREAKVVYPPVEVSKFKNEEPEDYFLAVMRPSPEKRVELVLKAFEKLGEKLILVGDYQKTKYRNKIKKKVGKLENVKWLKEVPEKRLIDLYSRCKAVVATSIREDFGIVPVEAMASGKPVIAVNEGGYKETIIENKTGILVDPPYLENLVKALKNFKNSNFKPKDCMDRAKEFSEGNFIRQLKEVIKEFENG